MVTMMCIRVSHGFFSSSEDTTHATYSTCIASTGTTHGTHNTCKEHNTQLLLTMSPNSKVFAVFHAKTGTGHGDWGLAFSWCLWGCSDQSGLSRAMGPWSWEHGREKKLFQGWTQGTWFPAQVPSEGAEGAPRVAWVSGDLGWNPCAPLPLRRQPLGEIAGAGGMDLGMLGSM